MRGLVVMLSLALMAPTTSMAEERATTKDAERMVHKAVEFLKAEGKEKAFAVFSDPKGQFTFRDLYITVFDLQGTVLAHGVNRARIGKNVLNEKDADGTEFVKERTELARKNGKGWQDYKFLNPVTKQVERKVAYFELVDGVIVMCGAYRG